MGKDSFRSPTDMTCLIVGHLIFSQLPKTIPPIPKDNVQLDAHNLYNKRLPKTTKRNPINNLSKLKDFNVRNQSKFQLIQFGIETTVHF